MNKRVNYHDSGTGQSASLVLLLFIFIFAKPINTLANNTLENACPILSIGLTDKILCKGDSILLDAGYSGSTYAWSNGQSTQTITITNAGTYSVLVTDVNGCTGIGQSVISAGGLMLNDNHSITGTCQGHYATLDAGNPGNKFQWARGDTTQTIRAALAGNYPVTVIDSFGCSITFSLSLVVNPLPQVTFNFPSVCEDDSVRFNSTVSIASGNASNYLWYFGDGGGSYAANPTHYYALPGTYTVKLTVKSDSGCIGNFTTTAIVNPKPVALFEVLPHCFGDSTAFLQLSYVLNDSIAHYVWNLGDGNRSQSKEFKHFYSSPGQYQVQLVTGSSHNCYDTIIRTVDIWPMPDADAGIDKTACSGLPVSLGESPQAGTTYSWFPATCLDQTNTLAVNFMSVNDSMHAKHFEFTLFATSRFGCTDTDKVNVLLLPSPDITFNKPDPQCLYNNSFCFSPNENTANMQLTWDFGNAFPPLVIASNPPAVKFLSPGKHAVTLTYSYLSCPSKSITDTITIFQSPESKFSASALDGCIPLKISLRRVNADPDNSYTWNIAGNNFTGADTAWQFNEAGDYSISLIATNKFGCTSNDYRLRVHAWPLPVADYFSTPESADINDPNIEFTNNSSGAVSYLWNFGDGTTSNDVNTNHNYRDTGNFIVSLIAVSRYGCIDTISGFVRIGEGFSFYIPNAFTPNGDGVNDTFKGYGTYIHSYQMWIFNRWGEEIYYTKDYHKPWDGKIKSVVQNDTYVYRIIVSDSGNNSRIFTGRVSSVK